MGKLLLVDGHNLLFQMFFGMPSRIINKEGVAIQGVVGFVGAIRKIAEMTNPTHILVVFDGENGGTRQNVYADYKANRPDFSSVPDEENPFSQYKFILSALEFMKIPHVETVGYEADDLISAYAKNCPFEVIISSFDSDYFQLIDEKTSVLRYRGKSSTLWNEQTVMEKYGVSPKLFADYKALVGDSADNVKGLFSVGPKTAVKLLNAFGSVENIIKYIRNSETENLSSETQNLDNVIKRIIPKIDCDRLERNYRLIVLDGNTPLPVDLDKCAVEDFPLPKTTEVIRSIGL